MPEWLDNLYSQKKGKYQGVRKKYRECKRAIKTQRLTYNELERSMIAYNRVQGESISKIDDAPAINQKLNQAFERVQRSKNAHDAAMDNLHTSLPELFDLGHEWILDSFKTLHANLNIPYTHLASAFGILPSLFSRWLKSQKDI